LFGWIYSPIHWSYLCKESSGRFSNIRREDVSLCFTLRREERGERKRCYAAIINSFFSSLLSPLSSPLFFLTFFNHPLTFSYSFCPHLCGQRGVIIYLIKKIRDYEKGTKVYSSNVYISNCFQ
jgi:hypothetical protein